MSDELDSSSELAKTLLELGYKSTWSKGEALRWAAEQGLADLVRSLLAEGADPLQRDTDTEGFASLHCAVFGGSREILELLLSAGADLEQKSALGWTPMQVCATLDEPDTLRCLASLGADINCRNEEGIAPIHNAALHGFCDTIQTLIELGADPQTANEKGFHPLHIACFRGHRAVAKTLLKMGANISCTDKFGLTPLNAAIKTAMTDVISTARKDLVESGADVLATDEENINALHRAALLGSTELAAFLLDHGVDMEHKTVFGETPLAVTVKIGHTELLELLLAKGADINARDNEGFQPVHLAAKFGREEIMRILLEQRANIEATVELPATYEAKVEQSGNDETNARNEQPYSGKTPFLIAILFKNMIVAHLLAKHGANLTATTCIERGWQAVHLATSDDDKFLLQFLIDIGGDIEARTKNGRTPLLIAISKGYQDLVYMLIKHGANPNAKDNKSRSALHYAARFGHTEIVALLLEYGADILAETQDGLRACDVSESSDYNTTRLLRGDSSASLAAPSILDTHSVATLVSSAGKGHVDQVLQILKKGVDVNSSNQNGRTALSVAAENGDNSMVRSLIEQGANVNLTDRSGESALWWAARYGHQKIISQLLAQNALIDESDCDGQSPLSAASQHGHVDLVELLLHRGGNPNSETKYGKTPLLFAAAAGHLRIVKRLMDSGANPAYTTRGGDTALKLAMGNDHEDVVMFLERHQANDGLAYSEGMLQAAQLGRIAEVLRLIESGANARGIDITDTPIFAAASNGKEDMIRLLIKHGADVHFISSQGLTALATAAYHGHSVVVRMLHEQGASIEQIDFSGRVPLMFAAAEGHKEVVQTLLELGARTETKDENGQTAIWHAADQGAKDVVKLLLVHGANKESADGSGATPLMAAVVRGHRDVAELLLQYGASMRPESTCNYSPLCQAALNGDEAMVDLLLHHRADQNHLADLKMTAIHLAAREGSSTTVKMLIEAGSNTSARNDEGRTPMSLAKERGSETIVKLFTQVSTLRQPIKNREAFRWAQEERLARRPSYTYRGLTKERSIRVMRLHSGKADDVLQFELLEVELDIDFNLSFEALSYEWHGKTGTVPVQCEDQRLLVTPNCKAAMLALRQKSTHRYLWIDAVCMNQQDDLEKWNQLKLMTDIYRNAKSVIMWLGNGSVSTYSAFHRIPDMVRVYEMYSETVERLGHTTDRVSPEDCREAQNLALSVLEDLDAASGFEYLYRHSYFTRVWIFQEVILAGDRGVAVCGDRECSWPMLKNALQGYEDSTGYFNRRFWSFYSMYNRLSRPQVVDLRWLLVRVTSLQATNPEDKIIVTLNLVNSLTAEIKHHAVDYNMTVQEAYIYATRHFIEISRSALLWVVGNRRSTKSISKLPTWVPDYQQSWEDESSSSNLPQLASTLSDKIPKDASSNQCSLYINAYLIDRTVFKSTIRTDMEVYDILLSATQALAGQARSIYDDYPSSDECKVRSDPSCAMVESAAKGDDGTQRDIINGQAFLNTVMDMSGVSSEESMQMLSFLAWALSNDPRAPASSKRVPEYMLKEVADWDSRAKSSKDFNHQVCKSMEDRLHYDRDLVYTKNGYFGITNGGEAEEGLAIGVIAGAKYLTMLEKKQNGDQEVWFEYVDNVYMNYARKVETLEEISGGAKMERLEIR